MPGRDAVLVLFDIDGTLVRTAGAGVRGLDGALERLHGRSGAFQGVAVAGRTDRAILTEVFGRWNETLSESVVAPLRDLYLEALAAALQQATGPEIGVLPGVHAVLDALEADPSFAIGLLTGNFERAAEIKLSHFDLWRRFPFGAFGDAHVDRRDLVPVAVSQARAAGVEPSHVVVIGDTPYDVDCARAHGARAIAVATGGVYSHADLAATGADMVVDTLEALQPVTDRLTALLAMPNA